MSMDDQVERVGRWTANRVGRRGFIGRMGKVGVMVAGGSTMAALLSDIADARVCGQSGISPLCPDYDCSETMGWCWYAVGCCAGGQLKKICDCCAPVNNVHGYCPSGTNVLCVLESCGTDPRVQLSPVTRVASDDRGTTERLVRQIRFPGGSSTVVLCESDALVRAVATPLASVLGAALVHQEVGPLASSVRSLIAAMGASSVKVVGSALPPSIDVALGADGVQVERVGAAGEVDVLSGEVAQWLLARYSAARVVSVEVDASSTTLAIAAAFAASARTALVVGAHAVLAAEHPVTAIASTRGLDALVPGSTRLDGSTPQRLAAAVAAAGPPLQRFTLVPETSGALLELAALGVPLVLHDRGSLGSAEAVLARRDPESPGRCYLAGISGTLTTPWFRRLQSDLNGYGVHLLRGVSGQGLPVISQPFAERPVGLARPGDSPPPPSAPSSSWLGWGG